MKNYKKFRAARVWSNQQLKEFAYIFSGSIVNVSAWKDQDKEGNTYRNYFVNADKYSITNYGGTNGQSEGLVPYEEYELDLLQPLSKELFHKFQTVFNHTTLEHVYDNRQAFRNLCDMATDAVIVVVPWVQEVHVETGSYDDYWRYSPYAMEKLYEENGYSMVVCRYNNDFDTAVYLFCIGIRNEMLVSYPQFNKMNVNNINPPGEWIGTHRTMADYIKALPAKMIEAIRRKKPL